MATARRSPAAPRRAERLEVRCTAELKELLQRAAALHGQTVSDFLVASARQAAEQAVREHDVITLSARDSRALVEALLNPPEPSPRLRQAVERYQTVMTGQ